jgi:hypothetical protein
LLRLYIPIEETGQIRTVFNKVKSVFMQPNAPVVGPEVSVDSEAKELLSATMQKDFSDDVRSQAVSRSRLAKSHRSNSAAYRRSGGSEKS